MVGTKNGFGIARNLLIALAILLLTGVAGSFYMGVRARDSATDDVVTQARAIADSSLTLLFHPEDLIDTTGPVRIEALREQIGSVVIDPSDFESATLWSPEGEILYSTQEGRIGNRLDGERERIKFALRGRPQTRIVDGVVSVLLSFEFPSGVGTPAAVELTRSAEPITSAAGPWRSNALFMGIALLMVIVLLWRAMRAASSGASLPRQDHPRTEVRRTEVRLTAPAGPVQSAARPIEVPKPGLREEGDARRKAEDRARAAEERLSVLQNQYRKTLEELQAFQSQAKRQASSPVPDPRLEERAVRAEERERTLRDQIRSFEDRARALDERQRELEERARLFERQAQTLQAERDELTRQLSERAGALDGSEPAQRAEQEAIGLRAELEGAQTQLSIARRELESLKAQADRARELQGTLDATHVEALRARELSESAQAELQTARGELEDLRTELRGLRNEEQRAAMLEDELRAAKAELESTAASHRAELVEREADLEEKVRTAREVFQLQVEEIENRHSDALAARDSESKQRVAGVEAAAQRRLDELQRELDERVQRFGNAEEEIAKAQADAHARTEELARARLEVDTTVSQLLEQTESARAGHDRAVKAERDALEAVKRSERLAAELEDATQDNADLNRRLQELESRRALEVANAEGRANLDDLLRVTQERLAGQTEKLIAAEERAHGLERQLGASAERIEEIESELRQQQMAAAMREIRGEGHEGATGDESPVEAIPVSPTAPFEDRRATTPFMKELSFDAKKSLTKILGITQILKHKKDAKEQAQLIKQLTAYTRRLDHIVADLADADRLVHGDIDLTVRRTDLDVLVQRVVSESGVGADHEVFVDSERLVVAVDQLRTEQILAGLLRSSGDRTPPKKPITVRLKHADGGALISVEDPEPSSDASISPVVRRFAEAQGGWAKVESRESGGSSFRVFLPDGAGTGTSTGDLRIVVESSPDWESSEEELLVQELHRLSELTADD